LYDIVIALIVSIAALSSLVSSQSYPQLIFDIAIHSYIICSIHQRIIVSIVWWVSDWWSM